MQAKTLKTLLSLCLTCLLSTVHAADRRQVQEPTYPQQICTTLNPEPGNNQQRIQLAIDNCPEGQAVQLIAANDQNTFLSGPLSIRSGIWLWVDKGAVLAASANPTDYDKGNGICGTISDQKGQCQPFIHIDNVQGGGLVGEGTIDGRGNQIMEGTTETWWQLARRAQKEGGYQNVPRLIQVDNAKNLIFYHIHLINSPNFHLALSKVQGITVWGVVIDTPADARNTDGIDPGAATDVTIAKSFIRTGDDNIAIKAGNNGPTRFISILDNHFYSGHGMSIGSETNSGVSYILIKDLTLDGTTSGIRIKSDSSRGGIVENVKYENVCLRNNIFPITMDTAYEGKKGNLIPWYHDILLKNVSGNGGNVLLNGYDSDHPLEVTFDGVKIHNLQGWHQQNALVHVAEGGLTPAPSTIPDTPAVETACTCEDKWLSFPLSAPMI
ncbi:glycoside hydrolase family 28 protein [Symbiopectobacterium purcellii]|uniref:glycoside hydrolase family 28 protein n=1 Tax=Symbiopectobacterium purcellii TaxID=2871826 RepID=UPI003F86DF6A